MEMSTNFPDFKKVADAPQLNSYCLKDLEIRLYNHKSFRKPLLEM
jgi:hypothetical protein